MNLMEIAGNKTPGTYASVKFDVETVKSLQAYMEQNGIENSVDPSSLHSTVLYSRVPVDLPALGKIDPPWAGVPRGFEIWGDDKKCLVLTIKCQELIDRHQEYIDAGGEHDYPDFTPHVTLSYDVGDLDVDSLSVFDDDLVIIKETSEPLNEDWVA